MPVAMATYLETNGWHFNTNSVEYAASLMFKKDKDGKREYIEPMEKDELRQLLTRYRIEIDEEDFWDALYVANMCKADMMDGEDAAIEDEEHMARYVKRTMMDPDAAEGSTFACWYAKMCRAGIRPDWEDMI